MLKFDREYYENLMKTYDYNPFEFGYFDFGFRKIESSELQMRYLCHMNADVFSKALEDGKKAMITTGFGMSGTPHVGTISQILRIIRFQKEGIPTQIVLGDLDAYNGKNKELSYTQELVARYQSFITNLGYNADEKSIIRDQYGSAEVLITSYLLGKYMKDEYFLETEEDLHDFYIEKGKVDKDMTYRRKLSLALMTADFLDLGKKYDHVSVLLGIDEHKYVNFSKRILSDAKISGEFDYLGDFNLSAIYSRLTKGFNGYPKQSKSFPESSLNIRLSEKEIEKRIMESDLDIRNPEENVVYQIMRDIGDYSTKELITIYSNCIEDNPLWKKNKTDFVDYVINLYGKWK